jgi:hypothetical protein
MGPGVDTAYRSYGLDANRSIEGIEPGQRHRIRRALHGQRRRAQRAMSGSKTDRGERKVTRREAWIPGRSDQSNIEMNDSQGWTETNVSTRGSGSAMVYRHTDQVKYSVTPRARATARPPDDPGAIEDALGLLNEQTFGFKANPDACFQLGSSSPCLELDEGKTLRTADRASNASGVFGILRMGTRTAIKECAKRCRNIFGSGSDDAARGGPQALRPLADDPISAQKLAGHVPGTPQHVQRLKAGRPTSTFFRGDQAEQLTRRAWSNGIPLPGHSGVRDFEFGFPVGRGTSGGLQTRVRVHMDSGGRIHGHPVGRELVP